MYKLYVIGTSHIEMGTEIGEKSANILFKLIENINPSIIFEEITLKNYNKIYVNNEDPIIYERVVIKKYIENYAINNIPIDILLEPKNFIESYKKIRNALCYKNLYNKELIELIGFIDDYSNNNDIDNINTEYFENLIVKRERLMKDYFYSHMEQLIDYFNIFNNHMTENRENVMVKNIIEYLNNNLSNSCVKSVLLIGTAHKKSIKRKIQEISNIECELYYNGKPNGI